MATASRSEAEAATLSGSSDLVPIDRVLTVAGRREMWDWYGSAIMVPPDGTEIAGTVDIVSTEENAVARFIPSDSDDVARLTSLLEQRVAISANPQGGGVWRIEGTLSSLDDGSFAAAEVTIDRETIPRLPNEFGAWRIVYTFIEWRGHSHFLWRKSPEGEGRWSKFEHTPVAVFGRRIVISRLQLAEDETHITVTSADPWLTDSELDAIDIVVFLVAGSGGTRAAVEFYDKNACWQNRALHRVTAPPSERVNQIFPASTFANGENSIFPKIAPMIEHTKQLFESGYPLRPIVYHLFASQVRWPEIEVLFLGVMREAMLPKLPPGAGNLMDPDEFTTKVAPVLAAVQLAFADDEKAARLVSRRIEAANDWSVSERRRRLWDVVGFRPTKEEDRVLRLRDSLSHDGYILATDYDEAAAMERGDPPLPPYPQRLEELIGKVAIFRNLMVKCLLRMLDYSGPVVDARHPQQSFMLSKKS